MPTFRFQCQNCTVEFEEWHSIHDPHPTTHVCGGKLVQVITGVNTYAVGERGRHTKVSDATDRVWHKDMDAYSRLRREGFQPQQITGSDRMEATAVGTRHIETGQAYTDRQVSDGMERARQIIREGAK